MSTVDKRLPFFGVAEVVGDLHPQQMGAAGQTKGFVDDLTGDPVGHRAEECRSVGPFAPEEAGQHGERRTLDPGEQSVQSCLDEPVGSDVHLERPLVRDVAELGRSGAADRAASYQAPGSNRHQADELTIRHSSSPGADMKIS
ncbi:hypothetical protein ACFXPI_04595 [Streptomyces sp. NPDC059104]|uniref:hypothetical protein n=1 Tax=Streptomyces sp. NPDC059104 TaxID=3346729 RepID=UPI0036CBE464